MGDDFSVDTLTTRSPPRPWPSVHAASARSSASSARSAPLFLVNGNHEQAARCNLDGTPNNAAVWAQNARNALLPAARAGRLLHRRREVRAHRPAARLLRLDLGRRALRRDRSLLALAGPVDNAFGGGAKTARHVGDHARRRAVRLAEKTLEESKARYKFVFAHHVLGTGRGGIEEADLYEWGGRTHGRR